jgi:hypothetical protein
MKVAIMQPYFYPYAGYFRLIQESDLFVVYDCVQFPRRGYVHRAKYCTNEQQHWITLPIEKCDRSTMIKDITFSDNATKTWPIRFNEMLNKHRVSKIDSSFTQSVLELVDKPIDYLTRQICNVSDLLEIPCNFMCSSELKISRDLTGQDRIIRICHELGASEYINAPNGKNLYNDYDFNLANLTLTFLPDFTGDKNSSLIRILNDDIERMRSELDLT